MLGKAVTQGNNPAFLNWSNEEELTEFCIEIYGIGSWIDALRVHLQRFTIQCRLSWNWKELRKREHEIMSTAISESEPVSLPMQRNSVMKQFDLLSSCLNMGVQTRYPRISIAINGSSAEELMFMPIKSISFRSDWKNGLFRWWVRRQASATIAFPEWSP